MSIGGNGYREVLKDDESLAIFLRGMAKFDRLFCDFMSCGEDFTLRMEVRGNKGLLVHCRVQGDGFERPHGVEKLIEVRRGKTGPFWGG